MDSHSNRNRAFTLIEVLLVIVILGMLAGVAIVALSGTREGAKIDTTKALINAVGTALEVYDSHIGHYPKEEEGGIDALLTKPNFQDEATGEKWRGPYLKTEPKDAWGNKLNYELVPAGGSEGVNVPVKVWSSGPDGQSGTEDDIKNWQEQT